MTDIRVLIADDQEMVRTGLRTILESEPGIVVVAEASNGADAVAMATESEPDVICMDVQMPGMDGLEATRRIVALGLTASVLVLTTFDRDDYLFDALKSGASGFVLKTAGPEKLVEAVQSLARGDALLSPDVTRRVIARFATRPASSPGAEGPSVTGTSMTGTNGLFPRTGTSDSSIGAATGLGAAGRTAAVEELTAREREVLDLVARGMSNAEIAATLFVGESTVKTHVSKVLMKLELRDRIEAVVFAYEHGIAVPGV